MAASAPDLMIIAEWLRQREGEADPAWIERLASTFGTSEMESRSRVDFAELDRVGDRLWRSYLAARQLGTANR